MLYGVFVVCLLVFIAQNRFSDRFCFFDEIGPAACLL